MNEKNPTFTTHLPPSRVVAMLAHPEEALDERERQHVEECPRCREYLARLLGAVAARPTHEVTTPASRPASPAGRSATAEELLAEVEQLRELADFPGAFRILTSIVLIDGRPEIRQRCALASARLHREMGYFEIAFEQFRSLLESPGLASAAKIACLNNLAWFERQTDNLDAAGELLRQAAELGQDDDSLAVRKENAETLHQQAVLLMTRGEYAAAAVRIDEALRIRAEIDGPERLDLARSLLIQGAICSLQGAHGAGVDLLTRTLKIRRDALGPNHADVADVLFRLGDMYKLQGQHSKAKEAYDDAIVSFKKSSSTVLGTIGLARCHARLAEIYAEWDRPDVAQNCAARAIPVLDRYPECDRVAYESARRHAMPLPN